MANEMKTEEQIEQEMLELNEQFGDFLKTKGIKAKFKLAFDNMAKSAKKQHEEDVANFNAVKAKSAEDNKEFVEFLHTKGIKAKFRLVIENIKHGAAEAPAKTAKQIAASRAQAQAGVAAAKACNPTCAATAKTYTADTLADEFNAFLKSKGLDSQYTVVITEDK
jgi:hypothetical protein